MRDGKALLSSRILRRPSNSNHCLYSPRRIQLVSLPLPPKYTLFMAGNWLSGLIQTFASASAPSAPARKLETCDGRRTQPLPPPQEAASWVKISGGGDDGRRQQFPNKYRWIFGIWHQSSFSSQQESQSTHYLLYYYVNFKESARMPILSDLQFHEATPTV